MCQTGDGRQTANECMAGPSLFNFLYGVILSKLLNLNQGCSTSLVSIHIVEVDLAVGEVREVTQLFCVKTTWITELTET